MNRTNSKSTRGSKAALKTHALQTLTRGPLTRRKAEAFGVRPIYRRFPSSAGWPVVHGPKARSQGRGGSP